MSTIGSMTNCCPQRPSYQGGIRVYLPSGESASPDFEGKPNNPYDFQGNVFPGAIYVTSRKEYGIHACGVAVDENGDLVVSHGDGNAEYSFIDKLRIPGAWSASPTQEPELVGTINSDTSEPCKTQVAPNGFIYTGTGSEASSSGQVRKHDPSLFHEPSGPTRVPPELSDPSTLADQGPDAGFAFDAEDNLYGARTSGTPRIQKVDQNGAIIETFGEGEVLSPRDVAVNKTTGTVYVTDGTFESSAKDVDIFKAYVVPNSTTENFAATGQTAGVLHGEAEPAEAGEEVEGCEFEYTSESQYNSSQFSGATKVSCSEATPFASAEEVSAPVAGLTLEQPYIFRLVTEGPNGASNGTVHKFVPHAVINLETGAAAINTPRSATLHGSFDGNGDATEYYFEYGHGNPGVFTKETEKAERRKPRRPFRILAAGVGTRTGNDLPLPSGRGERRRDQPRFRTEFHHASRGGQPHHQASHGNRPDCGHPERELHGGRARHYITTSNTGKRRATVRLARSPPGPMPEPRRVRRTYPARSQSSTDTRPTTTG